MHDAYYSAAPASIWLVTYDGQWDGMKGESPYKWQAHSAGAALELLEEMEQQYPDRRWRIEEKDVS